MKAQEPTVVKKYDLASNASSGKKRSFEGEQDLKSLNMPEPTDSDFQEQMSIISAQERMTKSEISSQKK